MPVLQCLSTLRAAFDYGAEEDKNEINTRKRWDLSEVESTYGQYTHNEEMRRNLADSNTQHGLPNPVPSGITTV